MQCGEWLHADHVVHDSCCVRVVCAIVEFVNGARWVLKALIPKQEKQRLTIVARRLYNDSSLLQMLLYINSLLFDILCMARVDHTYGFGQVSEY